MAKTKSNRKVIETISTILKDVVTIDMGSIEKIEQYIEMLRVNDPKQNTKAIQAFLEFRKTLNNLFEEKKNGKN